MLLTPKLSLLIPLLIGLTACSSADKPAADNPSGNSAAPVGSSAAPAQGGIGAEAASTLADIKAAYDAGDGAAVLTKLCESDRAEAIAHDGSETAFTQTVFGKRNNPDRRFVLGDSLTQEQKATLAITFSTPAYKAFLIKDLSDRFPAVLIKKASGWCLTEAKDVIVALYGDVDNEVTLPPSLYVTQSEAVKIVVEAQQEETQDTKDAKAVCVSDPIGFICTASSIQDGKPHSEQLKINHEGRILA